MGGKALKTGICLAVISVCIFNLVYMHNIKEEGNTEVTGTYALKYDDAMDNVYAVFTEDGKYMIYQQCERVIEEGKYENEGHAVFLETAGSEEIAVVSEDTVYIKVDEEVKKLEKTDDTPLYVNVTRK